jgi:acetylornithine deacetylase/succinyl-diaminopimelate desuccinylase-like protein
MKAAFQRLRGSDRLVINLEGLAFGHVYHAGIAVRRLHITASAEGGHSWLHFGRASAIHGLIELGARIVNLQTPQVPRTTYNIGIIEGGHSINSIATRAGMWLDLRSEDRATLETLEQTVRSHRPSPPELHFLWKSSGTEAGRPAARHPLVRSAALEVSGAGV